MKLQRIVIASVFLASAAFAPLSAHADGKFWEWGWGPEHWETIEHFQPYNVEHPFQGQNTQWDKDPWSPSVWAQQRDGGAKRVVSDLFAADVFHKQYTQHGEPAVDVGPGFYQLGGNDQRRAFAMLDQVYGITTNKVFGLIRINDWNTGAPVGTYTQYGLQMK